MANRILDKMSLPFPVPARIDPDQDFGLRELYGDNHTGFDFNSVTGARLGVPIRAAGGGQITESFNGNAGGQSNYNKLRGTQVKIDHGKDEYGVSWATRYHMLVPGSQRAKGPVATGVAIGNVGSSGSSTTGPHLHFELWRNGVPVNPLSYLSYRPSVFDGDPGTASGDNIVKITNEEDYEDMIIQVTIPQKANPKALDTYVMNLSNHTYWWVPNTTQKNFIFGVGVKTYENQNRAILDGFTEITYGEKPKF